MSEVSLGCRKPGRIHGGRVGINTGLHCHGTCRTDSVSHGWRADVGVVRQGAGGLISNEASSSSLLSLQVLEGPRALS